MKEFPKVKAGQWVQPITRAYKMECCDCALVHSMHFRLYGGKIQFKAYRDNKLTAMRRKKRDIVIRKEN